MQPLGNGEHLQHSQNAISYDEFVQGLIATERALREAARDSDLHGIRLGHRLLDAMANEFPEYQRQSEVEDEAIQATVNEMLSNN